LIQLPAQLQPHLACGERRPQRLGSKRIATGGKSGVVSDVGQLLGDLAVIVRSRFGHFLEQGQHALFIQHAVLPAHIGRESLVDEK
jgi:hypothetical protein